MPDRSWEEGSCNVRMELSLSAHPTPCSSCQTGPFRAWSLDEALRLLCRTQENSFIHLDRSLKIKKLRDSIAIKLALYAHRNG